MNFLLLSIWAMVLSTFVVGTIMMMPSDYCIISDDGDDDDVNYEFSIEFVYRNKAPIK